MVAVAAGLFLDTTPGFFSFVLTIIAGMGFLLVVGSEKANSSRRGQREVALFHSCGPEVEARRLVDDDPRLEFAISDSDAHVGCLRPGGHVPIDTAHVVARHVRTRFAGLGAVAGDEAPIVALQQTVELAGDRQLEPAENFTRGVDVVGQIGVGY